MFLQLNHKNLEVYKTSREFLKECYQITNSLPQEERYNLTQQIRRAALSIKLNIAEGASRISKNERKRYYEISRGSVIEIDAAFETIIDLNYIHIEQLQKAGMFLNKTFAMLTRLINS